MPSCAGVGLWLPDVGGLVLYVTLPVVWLRPSDGKVLNVQPAAVAFLASVLASTESLLLPPPASATMATTAITATTRIAPPAYCSVRLREADFVAACSAARRSRRRRSF